VRNNVDAPQWTRMRTKVRNSSETVMVFEGNAHNLTSASRLAGRHGKRDRNGLTNLLFFDGHVATFPTEPFDKADLANQRRRAVAGLADQVPRHRGRAVLPAGAVSGSAAGSRTKLLPLHPGVGGVIGARGDPDRSSRSRHWYRNTSLSRRLFATSALCAICVAYRFGMDEGIKAKDRPTAGRECPGFRPSNEAAALGRFGGLAGKTLKAKGFFRVERVGPRWWMIDPEAILHHIAATSVSVAQSSKTLSTAFASRFKDEADWREQTITLLRDQGFTATGPWSNDSVLSASPKRLPYAMNLNFMHAYGKSRGVTKMGRATSTTLTTASSRSMLNSSRSATSTRGRLRRRRTTRTSSVTSRTTRCRSS
jgi:prepilin-type processing-associated H-X9-DG protein